MFRRHSNRDRLNSILTTQQNLLSRLDRVELKQDEVLGKVDDLARQIKGFENRMRHSLRFSAEMEAARESSEFAYQNFSFSRAFDNRFDMLKWSLEQAPAGARLEFGVASGKTLRLIRQHTDGEKVVGFDSFKGLPEHWRPGFNEGTFSQLSIPHVEGAEIEIGLFSETLEPFLKTLNQPIGFIHADADLYSSTKYFLTLCGPHMAQDCVIQFDEYFNYPGWQDGEHRALTEWANESGFKVSYIGYAFMNEQVAIRVTKS